MQVVTRFVEAYNAAADHYDDPANHYWDRFARRTLDHLAPAAGTRVLDAGCGSGAFTIPAAALVGATGEVIGVDLAAGLLALARRKAVAHGLRHVTFEERDFMAVTAGPHGFDSVVSVFSLFFVADMIGAVRHLWTLVRPGGTLVITTWGPLLFEPAAGAFWDSIARFRPDLRPATSPWERVSHPGALASVIASAGITGVRMVAERGQHPLNVPEDWWTIVLGSGFRATVDALASVERRAVYEVTMERLHRTRVTAVRVDTVYAICRKARNT